MASSDEVEQLKSTIGHYKVNVEWAIYDRLGCWKSRTINSFGKYLWNKPTNLTIESGQFLSFVKCRRIDASLITSSSTLRNFPFEKLNLLECSILFVALIATLRLVEVWTARNTQPIYLSYLMFTLWTNSDCVFWNDDSTCTSMTLQCL